MSFYFAEEEVTFGVQASNEIEVAQFSSTRDHVVLRLFTNDRPTNAVYIGSSNITSGLNTLYIGHSSNDPVLTLNNSRIGIHTQTPHADLDVHGSFSIASPTCNHYFTASNDLVTVSAPMRVQSTLYVDRLEIGGDVSTGGDGSLISTQGLRASVGDYLRFNCNSFCNVTDIKLDGTLYASNITPPGGALNVSGELNVDKIHALYSNAVTFTSPVQLSTLTGGAIDATQTTLKTAVNETMTLRALSPCNDINVDQSSLSNIHKVMTDYVYAQDVIPIYGSTLGFGNCNLDRIRDLSITGNFYIRGGMYTTDTYTCNTNQLIVENDGTGPALIVNQTGTEAIAAFCDDSNVIFALHDGGHATFGSLGYSYNLPTPSALVTVDNPSTISQTALLVKQNATTPARVAAFVSPTNVSVIDQYSRLGIGTSTPTASVDIYNTALDEPYLRIGRCNYLTVTATGAVGIGTVPASNTTDSLVINGVIRATNIVLGSGDGSGSSLFTSYGMIAPNGLNYLEFADMNFCNVANLGANRFLARLPGTETAPAFSFSNDPTTGMYQFAQSEIAFTLNGTARALLDSNYFSVNTVRLNTITSPQSTISLDSKALCNVTAIHTSIIQSPTADLSITGANLCNVASLCAPIITSPTESINVAAKALCNVSAIETPILTSPTQFLSVSGSALCNVAALDANTFAPSAGSIDFSAATLCNIALVSTPIITSPTATIDFAQKTLVNIATAQVNTLTSPQTKLINFDNNSLCNVTAIQTSNIIPQAGLLGFANAVLCNISAIRTPIVTSPTSTLDFDYRALCNITALRSPVITSPTSTVDFDYRSLCNVTAIHTSTIAPPASTLSLSGASLCNVAFISTPAITAPSGTLDIASSVRTTKVTSPTFSLDLDSRALCNVVALSVPVITSPLASIDFDHRVFCNVNTVQINVLTSTDYFIDLDNKALCNVRAIRTPVVTSPTANIDFNGKAFSNVSAIQTPVITSPTAYVNLDGKNLTNTASVSTDTLTSAGGSISIDNKALCNVAAIQTNLIKSPTANIDFSTANLCNVSAIRTPIVTSPTFSLDFDSRALCNVTAIRTPVVTSPTFALDLDNRALCNVLALRAPVITSPAVSIDFDGKAFSNVSAIRTPVITSPTFVINLDARSLCNVTALEIGTITSTAGTPSINFSSKSLCNVTAIQTGFIQSPTQNLDIGSANLCNVSAIRTPIVTSPTFSLDLDNRALCNVSAIRSPVITSPAVYIDFDGKAFSNVSAICTPILTSPTDIINHDGRALCNVNAIQTSTITPLSANKLLDLSSASLCNVAAISAPIITSPTSVISLESRALCNVTAIQVNTVRPLTGSTVSLDGNSLTGVNVLTVTELQARSPATAITTAPLSLSQLSSPVNSTINFTNNTLSNVNTLSVTTITSPTSAIGFGTNTLTAQTIQSSTGTLSLPSTTLSVSNITSPVSSVSFSGKDLANIANVISGSLVTSSITSPTSNLTIGATLNVSTLNSPTGTFDFTNDTLSNVNNLRATGTLYANTLQPIAGSNLTFGNADLSGINNLTIAGDLRVRGDLTVVSTTTCNTNQLQIDNDGTGPALIVNQLGAEAIASFRDDGAPFLLLKDGGQTIFGDTTAATTALVTLRNPATKSQIGLDVYQAATNNDIVRFYGPATGAAARIESDGRIVTTAGLTTSNITPSGPGSSIKFTYANMLEVESIVVRSNITVTGPTGETYTNLPASVVKIDATTGRILDAYISSNIVRLMANGLINPALLPPVDTYRNTLARTKDSVGIGLRNPQQKLHVHGSQCVTGGRIGVGTTTPLGTMHIYDDSASMTASLLVEQRGSIDALRVYGSNSAPMIVGHSSGRVGIATMSPAAGTSLHVYGTFKANDVLTPSLQSPTGSVNLNANDIVNVNSVYATNYIASNLKAGTLQGISGASITAANAVHITGYDTSLYTTPNNLVGGTTATPTRVGLSVDNNILAQAYLSVSDKRVKNVVTRAHSTECLNTAAELGKGTYKYTFIDPEAASGRGMQTGFLAQEVEELFPEAVRTTRAAIPSIMKEIPAGAEIWNLPAHGLPAPPAEDAHLKVIVNNSETSVRVRVIDPDNIEPAYAFNAPVFVYGPYVNDFKLIDTERLVPLAFGAIRELRQQLQAMEQRLDAILYGYR